MQAASNFSTAAGGDRLENQPPITDIEMDNVPDVPIPIAEYPDELKERNVVVPMEEFTNQYTNPVPALMEGDTDPLSPKVVTGSKQTEV